MTVALKNGQAPNSAGPRACCNAGEHAGRLHHKETRTPCSRTTVAIALAAIVALAVLVRVPYLTTRSIWYDEASSWQTASFPLADLPHRLRLNVHLPLYYVTLKAWMALFGDSVLSLRGLSVASGAATVAAVYLLAREVYLASRVARRGTVGKAREAANFALAAALATALSAYQINASIETRMYSLGTALTALSGWLLLRALRRVRWSWPAFTATSAALLYCHPYALFTVAAEIGFVLATVVGRLIRGKHRRAWWFARRVVLSALVMAVLFFPGFKLLRSQHSRVQRDYWIQPLNAQMLASTLTQFVLPVYVEHCPRPYAEALAVLAVVALATGTVARHARYGDLFLIVSGLGPMALAAIASLKTPIWEGRYFRFAHIFLIVMVVLAIWKLARRSAPTRTALLGSLCCALFATDVAFWKLRDVPRRQGMRGAIERILAEYRPGETLVADSYIHFFPAKYYAPADVKVRLLDSALHQFWGSHLISHDDLISQDELAEQVTRGVWFINHRPATSDVTYQSNPGLRGALIDEQFASEYDFGVRPWTVHVAHCVAPSTTPQGDASRAERSIAEHSTHERSP